jgi:glycosyltransferase 2 family protein
VRTALLLIILACCAYGLAAEWPQVQPWIGRLRAYSIAGSVVAAMAASYCMMLAWRTLLADLGSPLPVLVAARVTFVAQLGKYVPGAVWSFAAHVELGHDYDVPRRRGAASVIVALAVAVAVGLLIAAIALPLCSPDIARRYMLALLLVPVIAVCLVPPVLQRLLNIALRVIRQEPLDQQLSWRGLGRALAWTGLGWVLLGLQVWFLLADVTRDGPRSMLLALGAYALACSVALVLIIFPNGIGAREVLLAAALAPLLAPGAALAVALMARVVTTVSDLAWGGIGLMIARRSAAPGSVSVPEARRSAGRHRKPAGSPAVRREPQPDQPQGVPEAAA